VRLTVSKKNLSLNLIFFLSPLLLANKSTFNLGLAADDFWRIPGINSIPMGNLFNETINWISGRNLQIIWVKILTSIFGIENSDIWKYHIFGLILLGILGVVFFNFLQIIKVGQQASIIATALFILWPTHSETSFWIEQTVQVQLPLIFLILWLILNFNYARFKSINFVILDFLLIVFTLFTYDQAAFLIAFLSLTRTLLFVSKQGFKFAYKRFIPSLLILILWINVVIGSRKGGPEINGLNFQKLESFFRLWHNSFEINSRIFSPRFQPYGFYGYWPWSITIFVIFLLILILIVTFLFKSSNGILDQQRLFNYKSIFLNSSLLAFYLIIFLGFSLFIYIASTYYRSTFFSDEIITSRLFYVVLGILLFVLVNLFIDAVSKSERTSGYQNFTFGKTFLLICFYVSYFPVYLWSISPRHHLIPSFIVCLIFALTFNQLMNLGEKRKLVTKALLVFSSIYLATLAINFHFSARAFSQSWILKQRLYADLYSAISLNDYTPESSCWVVENPPQEFMGYPLFVYESPQLGLNYMYKLPSVNTCDPSQDLTRFNVLKLAFNPDITYFENFEYKFEVIPSQL
jgi:hypothetical protein